MNNSNIAFIDELHSEQGLVDICSGTKYVYEENCINLILFADAVTYTKSVSRSMWAIFSCIAELPPILRSSYENIIFHSIWSGPDIDFNLFLKEYNSEIDLLIKSGVKYKSISIKVKVLGFIGDAPARSKALNTKQFNGTYGCLMCLHPTERNSKNRAQIYPVIYNLKLRTDDLYLDQVKKAIDTNECYMGVKGFSYFSNWISIPSCVIYDYMHLSLIGTFKHIVNMLLENCQTEYYLGIFTFSFFS